MTCIDTYISDVDDIGEVSLITVLRYFQEMQFEGNKNSFTFYNKFSNTILLATLNL